MAKNKSIAQTVNLQGTPQAPAYKVAAQQVDTFVKGRSAEQILAQDSRMKVAANIDAIVETGAAAQKIMYERQVAALDTTAAKIQAELDDGTITRIEESKDYSYLPETLRVRIGQAIGKNDAYRSYEEVRSKLAKDPSIAMDEAAFEGILGGYNKPIDGQDGYNIHRQASENTEWINLTRQLRAEASSIRSAENYKTVVNNYEMELADVLNAPENRDKSAEELHALLAGVSRSGVLPSDMRTAYNEAIVNFVDFKGGRLDLLNSSLVDPNINNSVLHYEMTKAQDTIDARRQAARKEAILIRDEARDELLYDVDAKLLEQLQNDKQIDEAAVLALVPIDPKTQQPDVAQTAIVRERIRIAREGNLLSSTESTTLKELTLKNLNDSIGMGQALTTADRKTVKPTLRDVTNYINGLVMNPQDKKELINQANTIVEGGDLTKSTLYQTAFGITDTITNSDRLAEEFGTLQPEALKEAEQVFKDRLMDTYRTIFYEKLRDDGRISYEDEKYIKREMREAAQEIVSDWAVSRGLKFTEVIDPVRPAGEPVKSAAALVDTLLTAEGEDSSVAPKSPDSSASPQIRQANKKPVFDKEKIADPELLKQLDSLSTAFTMEDFEGLTIDQIAEAYGEDLLKAYEVLQGREDLEGRIVDFFTKTIPASYERQKEINKKLKGLTKAQRQYYDRTGKFPDE